MKRAAHELIYGAIISRRPEEQRVAVHAFLSAIEVVDRTLADGIVAVQLKAGLKRSDRVIGEHDLVTAGQALNRGWSAVSANLRHFLRIDTLDVHDWTEG